MAELEINTSDGTSDVCVDNLDFEPNTINFAQLLRKNYTLKIKTREEVGKAREQENPLALGRMSKDWTV